MVFLQSHGVGTARAVRIDKTDGDEAVEKVRENTYKVIQLVNDDDKEVFNGDIGRIQTIDLEEGILTIDFEGRSVTDETDELDEVALVHHT